MVVSEDLEFNARVVFRNCPPPNACHTPLVMSDNITAIASFPLMSGPDTTVTVTLSNIELYIVRFHFQNGLKLIMLVSRIPFLLFPWHSMMPRRLKREKGFY